MKLEGARILITGGATGIGRAIAEKAINAGAKVAVCGRRQQLIEESAQRLGAVGLLCDVRREAEVEDLLRAAVGALGGLDVLVNNAAIGHHSTLVDLELDAFRGVLETNVLGAFLAGRAAARHFIAHGGGTIVNVGSTAAAKGYPGGSAYAASKFALSALTECWRAELRAHDVRVMQVNPSEVQTPFGGRDTSSVNPTKLVAEDVAHLVLALIALEDRGLVTDATLWATHPRA